MTGNAGRVLSRRTSLSYVQQAGETKRYPNESPASVPDAALRVCHLPYKSDSQAYLKLGRRRRNGSNLRMDTLAGEGILFSYNKRDLESCSLIFDVTMTRLLTVCHLDAARLRPGNSIEQVVMEKEG